MKKRVHADDKEIADLKQTVLTQSYSLVSHRQEIARLTRILCEQNVRLDKEIRDSQEAASRWRNKAREQTAAIKSLKMATKALQNTASQHAYQQTSIIEGLVAILRDVVARTTTKHPNADDHAQSTKSSEGFNLSREISYAIRSNVLKRDISDQDNLAPTFMEGSIDAGPSVDLGTQSPGRVVLVEDVST